MAFNYASYPSYGDSADDALSTVNDFGKQFRQISSDAFTGALTGANDANSSIANQLGQSYVQGVSSRQAALGYAKAFQDEQKRQQKAANRRRNTGFLGSILGGAASLIPGVGPIVGPVVGGLFR